MQLFYIPDFSGEEILLDETESKHAVKVLRLNKGSELHFTDGKGRLYIAEITEPNPKKCRLKLLEIKHQPAKKDFEVHIAIAPPKNNERLEWFLEKATEIGIDEVTLLVCENSERRAVKHDRLEKILIAAMKQSMNLKLPKLNQIMPFADFIERQPGKHKFIAHCHGSEKPHLLHEVQKDSLPVILIGPEGDFSQEEVMAAKMQGFQEISLGNSRLRTETAGIVACHIVNLVNI